VTFFVDGKAASSAVTLNSAGKATYTTSSLAVGQAWRQLSGR